MHLRKLINTFHKEYTKKSTTIFLSLNSAPTVTRPIILKQMQKQKYSRSNKKINKKGRNNKDGWQTKSFAL